MCAYLRGPVEVSARYAASVSTLYHELSHVIWQNADESATDCFSLFVLRKELRDRFGATPAQADALYALAWQWHLMKPPEYQGCARLASDPLR